jgi:hypothetical protein
MEVEGTAQGIGRREALKRGAALGGAVVWATPVVQSISMSKAFGQAASPPVRLQGISFIEFRFTCADGTFFAKVEEINSASQFVCEGPNNGETCGVSDAGAVDGCGRFTLSDLVFTGNELVGLTVTLTCADADFVAGQSKCASGCVPAVETSGTTATFTGCPA